ncbi:uncharacterized protein BXZ73DRAFT_88295 [Epithele typhae]|uniref:uncharacterized protein n=1 Tax=Epithele typhae TaxID=378194 RepID=UPI002007FA55|nr:uncharacterized protein BXZ73DRAFT_88295 [Epithele typhae]KAH9941099.1 hypothetical protein BXZ73DRAFT_88295 [Epithele typhae]
MSHIESAVARPLTVADLERAEKGDANTVTSPPFPPVSSKSAVQSSTVVVDSRPASEEKRAVLKKPAAPKHRASRWIRFQLWFNTYRKFFLFVTGLNATGLILAATNTWEYPRNYTGAFVLGNLLCAVLMRNELFGRFLFLLFNTLFAKWTPLWFRLGCTSVLQHLGGIHSGCAVSGFVWLIFRMTLIFIDHQNNHDAVLIMGIITNLAVTISIVSAFPWVRNTHHNVFERHHRFIGWFGLLSTWVFVVLGDSYDLNTHSWNPDGIRVLRQQDFWFSFGMTVFIIIPWLTVRKVKVEIEVPSSKVAVLRFERGMQQGLLSRIARSSVMEYHAFGIISEGPQASHHYLICGVQGDFTRSLLKFAGVSNTSTLYRRGIRVCTGTGLGAALSTCIQSPDWYLIWIGSDQEKTFGPTISGLIHRHIGPERMCLWDSKARGGRPDIMQLVVFITSNSSGNSELMEGCKEAGIPAFGTLWDF